MSITAAFAMPHPPLAVPQVGRGDERRISKTLAAYNEAAAAIAALKPDTIIYITPHNVNYADYFHISPGQSAAGDFSRFNALDAKLAAEYDTELAALIAEKAAARGIPSGGLGERDAALDHGVMVPMWFINARYSGYKTVRVSQSGLSREAHYGFGAAIAEACAESGKNVVIIASGDLSHKLMKGGQNGYSPDGAVFDKHVTDALADGDFLGLFAIGDGLRENAAECGYNSYLVMAGAFDRVAVGSRLLAYEGPFGVGYAVASFTPTGRDEGRNFGEQYVDAVKKEAEAARSTEDAYRRLARRSLEHVVKTGKPLALNAEIEADLPAEMKTDRAGAFVSLHKDGRLRGCIGTIMPTEPNIAREIMKNAISAGLADNRFEPVAEDELPMLTYKVDILSAPERIDSADALDTGRYGVIVTSGGKRGLLLPNLEGIDTVERQIEIARRKGGISPTAPIELQRFEVTRHE